MQKISGMKLTGLTVSGFKCFAGEQSFVFGDITYITGNNHVGKSSIADAISFAITGKLYSGEASIDRLYNEEDTRLCIVLSLLDENGSAHELIRKRVNDKTAISYDGYTVRQKDLDALFGESEVFLSIFNPLFFIESMGNDGQALLQRHLPVVKHEQVLAVLTERERALLEDKSMLSPDVFVTQLREEIREYRDGLVALDGQKALLISQRSANNKDLALLEQRVAAADGHITQLRGKHEAAVDLKALEEQRTALLLRRDEMLSDKQQKPRTAQLDLSIQRAAADMEAIRQKPYESKYAPEIAKLNAELRLAGGEYHKSHAAYQNVRAGVTCPTCRRPITAENLETVKEGMGQELQQMMRQGMEKKAQLGQLTELDQKAEAVFEQWKKDDLGKLQQRLDQLQDRRNKLFSEPGIHEKSLADLQKQIHGVEWELENGGLTVEEARILNELKTEREKAAADYEALKTLCGRPEPDIEAKKGVLEAGVKEKQELIAAAIEYLGRRNDLTFRGLPLDKVAFSLFDVFKTTGEVKNVFRFTYAGRDYRKLSHSEKIFAGMEVSELIKALTGRNYPVFVDDSESVVTLARKSSGQVFLSRVVPKAPLTVAARDEQPRELPKAS